MKFDTLSNSLKEKEKGNQLRSHTKEKLIDGHKLNKKNYVYTEVKFNRTLKIGGSKAKFTELILKENKERFTSQKKLLATKDKVEDLHSNNETQNISTRKNGKIDVKNGKQSVPINRKTKRKSNSDLVDNLLNDKHIESSPTISFSNSSKNHIQDKFNKDSKHNTNGLVKCKVLESIATKEVIVKVIPLPISNSKDLNKFIEKSKILGCKVSNIVLRTVDNNSVNETDKDKNEMQKHSKESSELCSKSNSESLDQSVSNESNTNSTSPECLNVSEKVDHVNNNKNSADLGNKNSINKNIKPKKLRKGNKKNLKRLNKKIIHKFCDKSNKVVKIKESTDNFVSIIADDIVVPDVCYANDKELNLTDATNHVNDVVHIDQNLCTKNNEEEIQPNKDSNNSLNKECFDHSTKQVYKNANDSKISNVVLIADRENCHMKSGKDAECSIQSENYSLNNDGKSDKNIENICLPIETLPQRNKSIDEVSHHESSTTNNEDQTSSLISLTSGKVANIEIKNKMGSSTDVQSLSLSQDLRKSHLKEASSVDLASSELSAVHDDNQLSENVSQKCISKNKLANNNDLSLSSEIELISQYLLETSNAEKSQGSKEKSEDEICEKSYDHFKDRTESHYQVEKILEFDQQSLTTAIMAPSEQCSMTDSVKKHGNDENKSKLQTNILQKMKVVDNSSKILKNTIKGTSYSANISDSKDISADEINSPTLNLFKGSSSKNQNLNVDEPNNKVNSRCSNISSKNKNELSRDLLSINKGAQFSESSKEITEAEDVQLEESSLLIENKVNICDEINSDMAISLSPTSNLSSEVPVLNNLDGLEVPKSKIVSITVGKNQSLPDENQNLSSSNALSDVKNQVAKTLHLEFVTTPKNNIAGKCITNDERNISSVVSKSTNNNTSDPKHNDVTSLPEDNVTLPVNFQNIENNTDNDNLTDCSNKVLSSSLTRLEPSLVDCENPKNNFEVDKSLSKDRLPSTFDVNSDQSNKFKCTSALASDVNVRNNFDVITNLVNEIIETVNASTETMCEHNLSRTSSSTSLEIDFKTKHCKDNSVLFMGKSMQPNTDNVSIVPCSSNDLCAFDTIDSINRKSSTKNKDKKEIENSNKDGNLFMNDDQNASGSISQKELNLNDISISQDISISNFAENQKPCKENSQNDGENGSQIIKSNHCVFDPASFDYSVFKISIDYKLIDKIPDSKVNDISESNEGNNSLDSQKDSNQSNKESSFVKLAKVMEVHQNKLVTETDHDSLQTKKISSEKNFKDSEEKSEKHHSKDRSKRMRENSYKLMERKKNSKSISHHEKRSKDVQNNVNPLCHSDKENDPNKIDQKQTNDCLEIATQSENHDGKFAECGTEDGKSVSGLSTSKLVVCNQTELGLDISSKADEGEFRREGDDCLEMKKITIQNSSKQTDNQDLNSEKKKLSEAKKDIDSIDNKSSDATSKKKTIEKSNEWKKSSNLDVEKELINHENTSNNAENAYNLDAVKNLNKACTSDIQHKDNIQSMEKDINSNSKKDIAKSNSKQSDHKVHKNCPNLKANDEKTNSLEIIDKQQCTLKKIKGDCNLNTKEKNQKEKSQTTDDHSSRKNILLNAEKVVKMDHKQHSENKSEPKEILRGDHCVMKMGLDISDVLNNRLEDVTKNKCREAEKNQSHKCVKINMVTSEIESKKEKRLDTKSSDKCKNISNEIQKGFEKKDLTLISNDIQMDISKKDGERLMAEVQSSRQNNPKNKGKEIQENSKVEKVKIVKKQDLEKIERPNNGSDKMCEDGSTLHAENVRNITDSQHLDNSKSNSKIVHDENTLKILSTDCKSRSNLIQESNNFIGKIVSMHSTDLPNNLEEIKQQICIANEALQKKQKENLTKMDEEDHLKLPDCQKGKTNDIQENSTEKEIDKSEMDFNQTHDHAKSKAIVSKCVLGMKNLPNVLVTDESKDRSQKHNKACNKEDSKKSLKKLPSDQTNDLKKKQKEIRNEEGMNALKKRDSQQIDISINKVNEIQNDNHKLNSEVAGKDANSNKMDDNRNVVSDKLQQPLKRFEKHERRHNSVLEKVNNSESKQNDSNKFIDIHEKNKNTEADVAIKGTGKEIINHNNITKEIVKDVSIEEKDNLLKKTESNQGDSCNNKQKEAKQVEPTSDLVKTMKKIESRPVMDSHKDSMESVKKKQFKYSDNHKHASKEKDKNKAIKKLDLKHSDCPGSKYKENCMKTSKTNSEKDQKKKDVKSADIHSNKSKESHKDRRSTDADKPIKKIDSKLVVDYKNRSKDSRKSSRTSEVEKNVKKQDSKTDFHKDRSNEIGKLGHSLVDNDLKTTDSKPLKVRKNDPLVGSVIHKSKVSGQDKDRSKSHSKDTLIKINNTKKTNKENRDGTVEENSSENKDSKITIDQKGESSKIPNKDINNSEKSTLHKIDTKQNSDFKSKKDNLSNAEKEKKYKRTDSSKHSHSNSKNEVSRKNCVNPDSYKSLSKKDYKETDDHKSKFKDIKRHESTSSSKHSHNQKGSTEFIKISDNLKSSEKTLIKEVLRKTDDNYQSRKDEIIGIKTCIDSSKKKIDNLISEMPFKSTLKHNNNQNKLQDYSNHNKNKDTFQEKSNDLKEDKNANKDSKMFANDLNKTTTSKDFNPENSQEKNMDLDAKRSLSLSEVKESEDSKRSLSLSEVKESEDSKRSLSLSEVKESEDSKKSMGYGDRLKERISKLLQSKDKCSHSDKKNRKSSPDKEKSKTDEIQPSSKVNLDKTFVNLFGSNSHIPINDINKNHDDDEEYVPYPVSQVSSLPCLSPPVANKEEEEDEYLPQPIKASNDDKPEYIPTKITYISSNLKKRKESCDAYVPKPLYIPSTPQGSKCNSGAVKYSKGDASSDQTKSTKKYSLENSSDSSKSNEKCNKKDEDDRKDMKGEQNWNNKYNSNKAHKSLIKSVIYKYEIPPPTMEEISLSNMELDESIFPPAFCSNIDDIPPKPLEVGGHLLKLKSNTATDLKDFEGRFQTDGILNWKVLLRTIRLELRSDVAYSKKSSSTKSKSFKLLTPLKAPPSLESCKQWLNLRKRYHDDKKDDDDNDKKMDVKSSGSQQLTSYSLSSGSNSNSQHSSNTQQSSGSSNSNSKGKECSLSQTPILNKSILKTSTPFSIAKVATLKRKRRISWDEDVAYSPDKNQSQELFIDSVKEEAKVTKNTTAILSPKNEENDGIRSSTSISIEYLKNLKEQSKIRRQKKKRKVLSDFRSKKSLSPILEPLRSVNSVINSSIFPAKASGLYTSGSQVNQTENNETLSPDSNCSNSTLKKNLLNSQFRKKFFSPSPHQNSFSQEICGPSFNTTYGFKIQNDNLQEAKAVHEYEYLTVLCAECHITSRPNLLPDPKMDPISALIFSITQDVPEDYPSPKHQKGAIIVSSGSSDLLAHTGVNSVTALFVNSEVDLLQETIKLVNHWDPDILVGYEVQMSSWGYLLERGTLLITDFVAQLSRVPESKNSHFEEERDEYGTEHTHQIHIIGRIILNVWRLMRAEVALTSYTLESVAYHVLHVRVPTFPMDLLTKWWTNDKHRFRTLEHYLRKCDLTIELLERLDLITRTAELARLFGLQFYEVFSRGSQFRVESMMLRLSRGENMVALSPSVQQRSTMKAPEWLPLNMEPESRYYTDPVVVLDFQSLYPSMMIAYNYCYSTCLGKVSSLGISDAPFVFGASQLRISPEYLLSIIDQINISPCGVAFVQPSIRKGVLPKMLEEILNTRIMVKTSMKEHKTDASLKRVLHSRQLGLKLIANVTYGYTSANFSGRMPCVEIADSVVSKGRETLERAISLVNSRADWGGRVVYGDTDSLFVLFPQKSKEEAFKIGYEIAEEVTQLFPKPVKLKFEKVYLPCILQTKKRYVGYMYESIDQKEPIFDAKGIETVRRDGCPAAVKILEKSLKILFNSSDVSLVKSFVKRQFTKFLQGKVNIQDLIFAKEFRGLNGYRPGACVPAMELTRQWLRVDKRKEPRVGERVPYVIVYGAPGLPLIKLIRSPHNLLNEPSLRINTIYYVTKAIIPPLQRCFSLLGVDIHKWFQELPRTFNTNSHDHRLSDHEKISSITRFFNANNCSSCGIAMKDRLVTNLSSSLCDDCTSQPQRTVLALTSKVKSFERALDHISKICKSCIGHTIQNIDCISIDCPILFRRDQVKKMTSQTADLHALLTQI